MLPYTAEVFFALFETYNRTIWPAQVVAYVLALAAVGLALRPLAGGGRLVTAILAAMWAWTGYVHHIGHFATIDFMAPVYGWAFVAQAALFVWTGTLRGRVDFAFRGGAAGWAGLGLVAVALGAYPLVGWLLGHGWPASPLAGTAPGPTAILTVGLLLLAVRRAPWHLAAIPALWSLAAGAIAWMLGIWQDLLVPASALAGIALIAWTSRNAARTA